MCILWSNFDKVPVTTKTMSFITSETTFLSETKSYVSMCLKIKPAKAA